MPKRGRHGPYKTGFKERRLRKPIFLRQWRIYRNLTQEQLAERTGLSIGTVSGLETGKVGYSDDSLNLLADALSCEPGQILMVDPTKPNAIWSIWEQAKEGEKQKIVDVARVITGRKAG